MVGFTGYQALKARTALSHVASDFQTLSDQLTSGEQSAARSTLAEAQQQASVARANTHGPGWWLASKLPQVGPNVSAVRTVAEVTDSLAAKILPDVVQAAGTLRPDSLRPKNGRIDLAPISRVAPSVTRAAARLQVQARKVSTLDLSMLAPQIAGPVSTLRSKITDAGALADQASRAVRLLPPMMGADGRRNYLFAFQNNAEVRATGGIPGSFALISANHGKVTLRGQADAGRVGVSPRPVVRLTPQERDVFSTALARFPQDTNFTPDFPRTAQILRAMWERRHQGRLDGVVSADPVALSYLLGGTGPVKTAGGRTLSAGTAVPLLLSQAYAQLPDPATQNTFFNAAARSVFTALTSGRGNPRAVLAGLTRATQEHRILVWSAHPQEQRVLSPTPLAGDLAKTTTRTPDVGVFFNASRAYKLDYYLYSTTSLEATQCTDGRQRLVATVRLRSLVPRNVSGLSQYVAPSASGIKRGAVVVTAFVFPPVGGRVTRLAVDGKSEAFNAKPLDRRVVTSRTVLLDPQQQATMRVTMVSGPGQVGAPTLRVTPGARSAGLGAVSSSACS